MSNESVSAWFELMAQAIRGAGEAQEAMLAFSRVKSADDLAHWAARYLPAMANELARAQPDEWPETWWRLTGFVPRIRYLEQLERNEMLRRRLEEAEATIGRLRTQLGPAGATQMSEVTAAWQQTFTDMLKAQNEWLRAWKEGPSGAAGEKPADP
ncbi:MAG: hypothetical protein H3C34_20310 [Caldilineaceae bacterium]|nr:hypothetical protein [Caldilineaceae bacterium]